MSAARLGMVYLVGGGPGDPGLITLRAIELLTLADVVVHDRLVNPTLLDYAPSAEWIDVGKQPKHHTVPQDEINRILIEKSKLGKLVVRLKGGDPFVFGRGGEEAAALFEAGVPFEIVPGVTSAIAAPAYAGIPLTYRSLACSATVITGHRAECGANPEADWRRAAQGADTLVFLMGVHNLENIVLQMVAAGRPLDTPVALIEQGTTLAQRTVAGTLANICELATDICPPAVIIVGDVVSLREKLRWFDLPHVRPLLGRRLAYFQPLLESAGIKPFAGRYADHLHRRFIALGMQLFPFPVYRLSPVNYSDELEKVFRILRSGLNGNTPAYDWVVFTSAELVTCFFGHLSSLGGDARWLAGLKIAAVDASTAQALNRYGIHTDCIVNFHAGQINAFPGTGGNRFLVPSLDLPLSGNEWKAHGITVFAPVIATVSPLDNTETRLSSLLHTGLDGILVSDPVAAGILLTTLTNKSFENIFHGIPIFSTDPRATSILKRTGCSLNVIDVDADAADIDQILQAAFAQEATP